MSGASLGKPEQRPAMLGNPQFVGAAVKLPEPDIGGSGGKGHSLLAIFKQVFDAQSSAPLNQQGAPTSAVCRPMTKSAARTVPRYSSQMDGVLNRTSVSGGRFFSLQVPALHRPVVDAVVLRGICSGRERSWILPFQDFDRQVGRRNADRLERLNKAADGSLPDKRIVGPVDRRGRQRGQIGCDLRRDKGLAFAVGKYRQNDHDRIARHLRQFGDEPE